MSFFKASRQGQANGSGPQLSDVPEAEIVRLFSPASPVCDEVLLCGRSAEAARLVETLLEPGKHAIVYGERGVGKTSLANLFWQRQRELRQSVVAARVQADPSDNFSSLWRKALTELGTVESSSHAHVDDAADRGNPLTPDSVRRYLQRFCLRSTILIVDEFDRLQDVRDAELMADTIKSLSDYNINCTVIIVGVAETAGGLIRNHGSLRRCISCIPVRRMIESDLMESIQMRLDLVGIGIDDSAKRAVARISRGLPFFANKIAQSACLSTLRTGTRRIESDQVRQSIRSVVCDLEELFSDGDGEVLAHARGGIFAEVIMASALSETDEDGYFSAAAVEAPLSRLLGRAVSPFGFQRHLADLASEKRGRLLVRRGEPGTYRYRFRDALMQPFLVMQALCSGVIQEADAFGRPADACLQSSAVTQVNYEERREAHDRDRMESFLKTHG
jgi:hypothetical protein